MAAPLPSTVRNPQTLTQASTLNLTLNLSLTRAEKARVPKAAPRVSCGVNEQMSRVAATQPDACRSQERQYWQEKRGCLLCSPDGFTVLLLQDTWPTDLWEVISADLPCARSARAGCGDERC